MSALLDVNPPEPASLSHTFGNATVAATERERRIRSVFESVAPRYDLMNDLMSLGVHRRAGFEDVRWRDLSFGIACIHSGTRPVAGQPLQPSDSNGPHNPGKGWPNR